MILGLIRLTAISYVRSHVQMLENLDNDRSTSPRSILVRHNDDDDDDNDDNDDILMLILRY